MKQLLPFALRAILSIVLATFSLQAWGLACAPAYINLTNQDEVDNFQATYGGGSTCDTVLGQLRINGNDIVDLTPLSDLTSVDDSLTISGSTLTSLNGLEALTSVGHLFISGSALTSLNGLAALTSAGDISIHNNPALTNLNGLSSLSGVVLDLYIYYNELLGQCAGLARLIDQWDDAEPGPGPSDGGVPDVGRNLSIEQNLAGCNSVQEILATVNPSKINPGLNDAWYYPETSGQGFFITVFPDLGFVSLAWFTYDTELPSLDAVANLGDPGHRWITAVGPIDGNQVLMNIELTSGGIFDASSNIIRTDPPGSDGTIILTFDSCNSGTIEYDIPSISRSGTVPIQRVAGDNITLCEALNGN